MQTQTQEPRLKMVTWRGSIWYYKCLRILYKRGTHFSGSRRAWNFWCSTGKQIWISESSQRNSEGSALRTREREGCEKPNKREKESLKSTKSRFPLREKENERVQTREATLEREIAEEPINFSWASNKQETSIARFRSAIHTHIYRCNTR